jgi:hypothetical protein
MALVDGVMNSSATTVAGVTQEGYSVLAGDTNPVARRTPFEGLVLVVRQSSIDG